MTRSPFGRLGGRASSVQWASLIGLSVVLVVMAEMAHLPAALLLGPMVAAIVIGVAEGTIRVSPYPFIAAQAVIGCMIGHSVPLSIFAELMHDWPIFLTGVTTVIAASSLIGWLLTRWRFLPGTTAIWGTSPGASTAMILMSESYGADIRLVALMQYLRIVCVVVVATLVATLWTANSGRPTTTIVWFPPIVWGSFLGTLAFIAACAIISTRVRVPGGQFLFPLFGGMLLQEAGLLNITLPPWLLALSYAVVGWSIGLRFNRAILIHAFRALPSIFAFTFVLIAVCGGVAGVLVFAAGIDPLTAYLATSPGGVDSIAIIAVTSNADLQFVMAMQTARMLVVLLTSTAIARFLIKRSGVVPAPPR